MSGLSRGQMEGAEFVFPFRVYYEDTDAAGIVYYANYLKFAERGRTEFLRFLGVDQIRLRADRGLLFAVRRAEVEYLKPARLDDVLEVRTRLTALGATVIDALQRICRGPEVLAEVVMRVVCLETTGMKPARIPKDLRAHWMSYVGGAARLS